MQEITGITGGFHRNTGTFCQFQWHCEEIQEFEFEVHLPSSIKKNIQKVWDPRLHAKVAAPDTSLAGS